MKHKPNRTMSRKTLLNRKKLQFIINTITFIGKFGDNQFEKLLPCLSRTFQVTLLKSSIRYAKKLKLDISKYTIEEWMEDYQGAEDLLNCLYRNSSIKFFLYSRVLAELRRLADSMIQVAPSDPMQKKMAELSNLFSLNDTDQDIVMLLFLIATDVLVDQCSDALHEYFNSRSNFNERPLASQALSVLLDTAQFAVQKSYCSSSMLMRSGLLNKEFRLADDVIDFLQGLSDTPIENRYFAEYMGPAIPIKSHIIDDRHLKTIEFLTTHRSAGKALHLLLYGTPGTGKTELARSLGRHLGLQIFEIKTQTEGSNGKESINSFRHRALVACQRKVDTSSSVIIIDEADSMLNSSSPFFFSGNVSEKGQLNSILDSAGSGIYIWITNNHSGIDESTRRRFDYSVGFNRFSFSQRKTVWEMGLKKHGIVDCFGPEHLNELVENYEINAGGIDVALRSAARAFTKGIPGSELMPVVQGILKSHLKLMDQSSRSASELVRANAPEYGIEGLHVKGNLNSALSIIDRFNHYWATSLESMPIKNMNTLLYGPPGSGKTELAKYIARRTNRRLIVKKASDLLSMWVGGTEENICRAFDEAERDKAILFIDEADGLFSDRQSATKSWEVTQVNELLTQMETFKGMLICSTNFKTMVDSAAIRRFNIKLELDYLQAQGTIVFYERFMGKLIKEPISDAEANRLKAMSCLTPGDFKVVYQKFSFYDESAVTHDAILTALGEEARAKNGRVGRVMGFGKPIE